ncbi:MAG: PLD nuclease N-terminal domain-containing protein [Evtepia sp.]|nr:PLD nuclease N-terminal domain-containing protein [Evtepia sp.]
MMDRLLGILPLLIPVFVVDIALAVAAVAHILRHPHYRFGNQTMWLVVAIALWLFGPMIYFVFGKGEDE